jgi:hypothetical protein
VAVEGLSPRAILPLLFLWTWFRYSGMMEVQLLYLRSFLLVVSFCDGASQTVYNLLSPRRYRFVHYGFVEISSAARTF